MKKKASFKKLELKKNVKEEDIELIQSSDEEIEDSYSEDVESLDVMALVSSNTLLFEENEELKNELKVVLEQLDIMKKHNLKLEMQVNTLLQCKEEFK